MSSAPTTRQPQLFDGISLMAPFFDGNHIPVPDGLMAADEARAAPAVAHIRAVQNEKRFRDVFDIVQMWSIRIDR